MRKPESITFTGVDDHTDIHELKVLSVQYPVEWGVLFSPSRQGIDKRYPGGEMQSKLLWSGLPMAAHLCGQHSRDVMTGGPCSVPADLFYFRRMQINSASPDPRRIEEFRKGWGTAKAIAQHRDGPFPDDETVQWLYDRSGGKGVTPDQWPAHPGRNRLVGYAGGINPSNILDVIKAINSDGPYWLDMESGVRTDDVFDLSLCRQVCELVFGASTN